MRTRPKKRSAGRFPYNEIVERVEKARIAKEIPTKDLCAALGITQSQWSRKIRGLANTFTLDELGLIADALDAPEGWPFVEWKP